MPIFGHGVLFGALIAFSFVTLLMLPFLDSYPRGRIVRPVASGGIRWGLLAATVASVFLFQAGNMGLAVYLIPLARALRPRHRSTRARRSGSRPGSASRAARSSSIFGTRFGRAWPLAIGAVAHDRRHASPFHWSASQVVYLLANCLTSITWSFAISYLLGMCAEFDQTGRTAALGGFLSKMGLASGPFVAAWLLEVRRLRGAHQRLGDRARGERAR